jgi:hypothetical protein
MPFDNTPITETKPDVFSLDSLIAWLKTQPGETEYNWASNHCLLCRYLRAHGVNPGLPLNSARGAENYDQLSRAAGENRMLDIAVAMPEPFTYAAALSRALELKARS